MQTRFVEVTNDSRRPEGACGPEAAGGNHGKFMVARFDGHEWARTSAIDRGSVPLLDGRGWSRTDLIVFDLETCEGAGFSPGGAAQADLEKHRVWTCPMFLPFLEWLYRQDLKDLDRLPRMVNLPNAEFRLHGKRGRGPEGEGR